MNKPQGQTVQLLYGNVYQNIHSENVHIVLQMNTEKTWQNNGGSISTDRDKTWTKRTFRQTAD